MAQKSKEVEELVVDLYLNNKLNIKCIALKLSISKNTVQAILKRKNINKRIPFLIDENALINKYLNDKLSISECCREFKTSYTRMLKIFKKHNIKHRNYNESIQFNPHIINKYYVNESFFDNPESWGEKQAWTLGWLGSDGNNYTPKHSFFIKIQERDKQVLDYIKSFLEYEGPMIYNDINKKNPNHSNTWCLQIRNKKLSENLYKLGIIDNKSLKYEFPSFIREDLIRHFIRGYFEGDGCFGKFKYKNSNNSYGFYFNQIGTKWFLEKHQDWLVKQVGIHIVPIKLKIQNQKNKYYNDITSYYNISDKKELLNLYFYLYNDCKYFLTRKKEKFHELLCYMRNNKNYKDLNIINV